MLFTGGCRVSVFVGLLSLPKAMKVVLKKVMYHLAAALPKLT